MSATSLARRRLPRLPRVSPRFLIAAALAVAVLAFGWLWLRDSSLVAVRSVTISGASGPDAGRIAAALRRAALGMTTLDVNTRALDIAVSPYTVVKRLDVSTRFPHGMQIRVVEELPIAVLEAGGARPIPVTADGTMLPGLSSSATLPVLPVAVVPAGARLTDPRALGATRLLGAAPYALLSHIQQVDSRPGHGLVAQLRGGPQLFFGDAGEAAAKWSAVVAVLADPGAKGASYIDVTDPRRPAAGSTDGSGSASGSSSTSGSSSAAGTPASTSNSPSSTG